MATEHRREKLNYLLREELAKIINKEIGSPSGEIVTITRVVISPDVHYADVFISLLGNNPESLLETLKKNVYTIQQVLNKKLRVRPVPRIKFKIDAEELKRERLERTLAQLKQKGEL